MLISKKLNNFPKFSLITLSQIPDFSQAPFLAFLIRFHRHFIIQKKNPKIGAQSKIRSSIIFYALWSPKNKRFFELVGFFVRFLFVIKNIFFNFHKFLFENFLVFVIPDSWEG